MPFGLGKFFKGRKIVFAFALEDLQSIHQQKHGLGRKEVFRFATVLNLDYSSARDARRGCSRLAPLSDRFVPAGLRVIANS
jgi:hypothetical protein